MPIFPSVNIIGQEEEATPVNGDFVLIFDVSEGENKKAQLTNLPGVGGGSTLDPADRLFAPSVTSGNGSTTGKTITNTVAGDIAFFVNGIEETIGDGVKTKSAYFSVDGGTTARAISAIVSGDTLFWNGVIAGYELSGSDSGRLFYDS